MNKKNENKEKMNCKIFYRGKEKIWKKFHFSPQIYELSFQRMAKKEETSALIKTFTANDSFNEGTSSRKYILLISPN